MPELAVPAHVPPELVHDFDIWSMPPGCVNPHDYCLALRDAGAPPIFYTPRNGGHWLLHRFEDTLEGYRDTDFFTNFPNGVPAREGGPPMLIPVEVDPPNHVKYRNVLGPAFSPVVAKRMESLIRARVGELIDAVIAQGHCNFAEDISGKLPTSIFIGLIGMPMSDFDHIMEMEHRNVRGKTPEIRESGANDLFAYVRDFILSEANNPGDNLAGTLLRTLGAQENAWTMEEIINCASLLYIAGLDTVTNMMNFIWYRLAREPEERHYVAAHADQLPTFVDELMRLNVTTYNARRVREDGIWRGVFMKAGDAVLNAPFIANRDPAQFPDPDAFQPDRANARHHIAFGAGPHRCVGQHLARLEVLVSLQEWFRRIPEFRLDPARPVHCHTGNIMGMSELPLTWNPQ